MPTMIRATAETMPIYILLVLTHVEMKSAWKIKRKLDECRKISEYLEELDENIWMFWNIHAVFLYFPSTLHPDISERVGASD